jgi:acyl-CoA synthetase (AMP-forming)/AMP-acid ligase II
VTGPVTVVELLERRAAEKNGARLYVFVDSKGRLTAERTYAQQAEHARRIAKALRQHAVKGDRVVLLLPPGLEFTDAFFGTLYAGMIAVPAYPPMGRDHTGLGERLRGMVADASPALVLTTIASASRLRSVVSTMPGLLALPWLTVEEVLAAPAVGEDYVEDVVPEDIALLQYTSGSISRPKGVIVRHGNVVANQRAIRELLGEDGEGLVGCSWLPPQHDMGLIGTVLQPLFARGWSSFIRPIDFVANPMLWLQLVSEQRSTVISAPDFAYRLCVERADTPARERLELSSLKVAMVGAERVRAATLESFASKFEPSGFSRRAFRPVYGLAEATLLVSGVRDGQGHGCVGWIAVVSREAASPTCLRNTKTLTT